MTPRLSPSPHGLTLDIQDFAPKNTVARMVAGFTMGGIRDGWIVLYEEHNRLPGPEEVGELCVVETVEGRCYVRFLHAGQSPGRYDLVSVSGPTMLDVELRWASRVNMILPYRPSEDERRLVASGVGLRAKAA